MKVIGFTLQSNVPRQHFIGNAECIVPEPGDEHAAVALAALVRAMLETESVAIIRYVKRNNSVPHLGVLVPYIHYSSEIRSDWECFYYIKLPFAEDLRQYPFASLDPSRARKSFVPSPEELSVAEKLINSLDLMTAVKDEDDDEPTEALKPKQTFNPALQHFYQCVQKRAMNPKAPIPPLDPDIHVYVNPDAELFSRAADSLAEFKKTFPLVPVNAEEDNKKRRRFWRDAFDTADVTLDSYIPDPKKPNKAGDKLSIDVSILSVALHQCSVLTLFNSS
jgi:ATP-dependent DNA helicase 2 subunit 2